MTRELRCDILAGAAIVLLTFIVYMPAFNAGYLWDDAVLLTENRAIHANDGIRHIWLDTTQPDYFPLTLTTFWLEWRLWGDDPAGYHITNITLHVLGSLLIWRVLLQLGAAWSASFFIAALFAVHPVNVASVAWIAERKNTLSLIFFVLTVWCYLLYDSDAKTAGVNRWYFIAMIAFALALLSKTSVVMLPVVLLLLLWWRHGRVTWRDVSATLPLFVMSLLMGLVTIYFQHHNAIRGAVVRPEGFASRLAGAGRAVWFYLGQTFWPSKLSMIYPRWSIDVTHALTWLPLLMLLMVMFMCWRWRQGQLRTMFVAMGYTLVMLAPVLGFIDIYFFRFSFVADHWHYLSQIGVIAIAVAVVHQVSHRLRRRVLPWCVWLPVMAVLSVLTWQRATVFQSKESLWRDTIARNERAAVAHSNLALVFDESGRIDQALHHYDVAARLDPYFSHALHNRAKLLWQMGRLEDAAEVFAILTERVPQDVDGWHHWAVVLVRLGRHDDAMDKFNQALQRDPKHVDSLVGRARLHMHRGDMTDARQDLDTAIAGSPHHSGALCGLGRLAMLREDWLEARGYFERALRVQPNLYEVHHELGQALIHLGEVDQAVVHLRVCLQLKPDYTPALIDLLKVTGGDASR